MTASAMLADKDLEFFGVQLHHGYPDKIMSMFFALYYNRSLMRNWC